jgi:hypothetical protein
VAVTFSQEETSNVISGFLEQISRTWEKGDAGQPSMRLMKAQAADWTIGRRCFPTPSTWYRRVDRAVCQQRGRRSTPTREKWDFWGSFKHCWCAHNDSTS